MRFASSMQRLGTETAFEVLARAKALEATGRSIVHLEIGEPDFDTPRHIREAAKRALDDGATHYGPSAGLPEHRAAVAEYVSRTRGIPVEPEEVVITPGGKPIIFFTLLACVEPGDEVIYPDPGFPIYESMIRFIGAKPVPMVLREDQEFRLDVAALPKLITRKTRFIILNSPANPTGGIVGPEDLAAVAKTIGRRDLWVLSDEIYSRILYDGFQHHSLASLPGMKSRTIILDGYSKTYAMTGWRAGYGVMPRPLAAHVTRLQANSNSCAASFTQRACLEALRGPQDEVDAMVSEFRRQRDVIVDGLNRIPGFHCVRPKGAFYVFPNITGTGLRSKALADRLLDEAGVACLSGTSFGAHGEGFLRFSYANSVENLKEALRRIEGFVSTLSPTTRGARERVGTR